MQVKGKKVLITAGPTYEKIDPVRFIGNHSTGKMGFALAEVCAEYGAEVELVTGPVGLSVSHPNIRRTNVQSAEEMYVAAVNLFPQMDAAILCAAVADFTLDHVAAEKIKRKGDELHLSLVPTKDIAAELGSLKRCNQKLVGFALETTNEKENAKQKMKKKNLDFIVLNSLKDAGAGFSYDTNKVTIFSATEEQSFPLKAKREVACDIIEKLCESIGNL